MLGFGDRGRKAALAASRAALAVALVVGGLHMIGATKADGVQWFLGLWAIMVAGRMVGKWLDV